MAHGVLAILGSGETAPSMTKVHRDLLARLENVRAVNLDSAYGFQENVPQMSEKLEEYFNVSLRTTLTTLHFANYEKSTEVERALFKRSIRDANYVFAGPGSPSWARAQWAPLDVSADFAAVLDADGTLCISSAAALTLGAYTAPIYEIYKVGVEPYWLPGLNLLGHYGLNCVVVPHFDNNEGANYDTRYCYLGQRRLVALEALLPEDVATLGADEHTALVFDFNADVVRVLGKSNGYWRHRGAERVLANDTVTPLSDLRGSASRTNDLRADSSSRPPLDLATAELESCTARDLAQRVSDASDGSLDALARLVQLAERGGPGFIDPTPLVDGILTARVVAKESGNYQVADAIRDALVAAGVEVHDGPTGSTWALRP